MGVCGCGGEAFDYQLPGPDEAVYALRIYRSCSGCHTPIGIDLVLVRPDAEDREFLIEDVPPLPFSDESYGQAWCSLPLLDAEYLFREMDVESDDEGLVELDVQSIAAALPGAVTETLRKSGWTAGIPVDTEAGNG